MSNIRIIARYRPEPDYERLARALLVLIEELDSEEFGLGDDPLAPPTKRRPRRSNTVPEAAGQEVTP